MKHRLVINLQMSAGAGAALSFEVTEDQAADVAAKLADPDAVLRFERQDARGRFTGETLVPVRAITHLSHDVY